VRSVVTGTHHTNHRTVNHPPVESHRGQILGCRWPGRTCQLGHRRRVCVRVIHIYRHSRTADVEQCIVTAFLATDVQLRSHADTPSIRQNLTPSPYRGLNYGDPFGLCGYDPNRPEESRKCYEKGNRTQSDVAGKRGADAAYEDQEFRWNLAMFLAGGEAVVEGGGSAGGVGEGGVAERMEGHHTLPRQFRALFEKAGLNVDDYIVDIPESQHRLSPDGVHAGPRTTSWNGVWRNFFETNPTANKAEILKQRQKMMNDFRISDY
jgi:hypothetical protein